MTCFWRFFQKSQLFKWLVFKRVTIFKRWQVLKKFPRVTNFNFNRQVIINKWPWHESNDYLSSIFHHLSSIFQSIFRSILQHPSINLSIYFNKFHNKFFTDISNSFLFIFLKVFVQHFFFQEKFFVQNFVLFIFFIFFFLCQKNRRTNRLNYFVSLFSLTKDSKD